MKRRSNPGRRDWEVTSWGDRIQGPFRTKREAQAAKRAIEKSEYSKSMYTPDLNLRIRRIHENPSPVRRVRNTGWIKAKAVKILKKAGGYIVKVRR